MFSFFLSKYYDMQQMCPQDGRIDDLGWNVDAHLPID